MNESSPDSINSKVFGRVIIKTATTRYSPVHALSSIVRPLRWCYYSVSSEKVCRATKSHGELVVPQTAFPVKLLWSLDGKSSLNVARKNCPPHLDEENLRW